MAFPLLWVRVCELLVSVFPQPCLLQGFRSGCKQLEKAKSPPQGVADLGTCWRTASRHFDLRVWEPPPQGGQKRVRPSTTINESLPALSAVTLFEGRTFPPAISSSFVNRKMSPGGVCPSWLRCQPQPQGQSFVHSRLHSVQEGCPAVLACPLMSCSSGSAPVSHPAALVLLCCFPSTALLLYTLIQVQVQPQMTYSRMAVFA